MIGSVTLKSECITAVMVLGPAAKAGIANIAESASVDANVERSRRDLRNIDLSWLETGQRPMIHYAAGDFRPHNAMVPLSIRDLHQACHASIAFPRGGLALAQA